MRSYYTTNYEMVRRFGFSLTELEDLIPFERDIYVAMVMNELERKRRRNGVEG